MFCDVETSTCLTFSPSRPILCYPHPVSLYTYVVNPTAPRVALGYSMASSHLRSHTAGAFDQYLHDIKKLPLITNVDEERHLTGQALTGDERAVERLLPNNLRSVIFSVKPYQYPDLHTAELVADGMKGYLKAMTT